MQQRRNHKECVYCIYANMRPINLYWYSGLFLAPPATKSFGGQSTRVRKYLCTSLVINHSLLYTEGYAISLNPILKLLGVPIMLCMSHLACAQKDWHLAFSVKGCPALVSSATEDLICPLGQEAFLPSCNCYSDPSSSKWAAVLWKIGHSILDLNVCVQVSLIMAGSRSGSFWCCWDNWNNLTDGWAFICF